MNISSELNLARKWRPLTFENIVGQELTVRLLKNSLFKQHFLPVYLLSGQRGCGKTTTGRVFAAAINCLQLDEFSRNPQHIVPCGSCASCQAMRHGNHPDFIEIDAASHTGVDNVRQIIEATTFLPHMGRKKIYLIDEAHMLSKAAFNAFLKILEEPPKTVLFMMATTDSHKIIDTVRSRCFQLFFEPLAPEILLNHLATICEKEAIAYEREALAVIVKEAEGSVRDALNLIERVRLAHDTISAEATRSVFGSLDDQAIINLVAALARKQPAEVVAVWQEHQLSTKPPSLLWKKLFDTLHACLLFTFSPKTSAMPMYEEELRAIAADMPAPYIIRKRCILSSSSF
jgi:DNA polymerase-3 subunit gamma/tau